MLCMLRDKNPGNWLSKVHPKIAVNSVCCVCACVVYIKWSGVCAENSSVVKTVKLTVNGTGLKGGIRYRIVFVDM